MRGGVMPVLVRDEGGDHGPPGSVDDVGFGTAFQRQRMHFGKHLGDALRRRYLIGRFLEGSGLAHVAAAFGDQRDQLAVDTVDVVTNLGQRGALSDGDHDY